MYYKIIKNNIIPFKGYKAMALWPYIFVRKGADFGAVEQNHECIHLHQQVETTVAGAIIALIMLMAGAAWWSLLPLGLFYELYGMEYVVRLFTNGFNGKMAYRNISFEREAYLNEADGTYPSRRKGFDWMKHFS